MMRHCSAVLSILLLIGCSPAHTLHEPLPHASRRATPLSFGLHVTANAAENPISPPERFEGYHVGLDFEVSQEELEEDVPVYAICSGRVDYSGFAEGYGGLLVQSCTLSGTDVTVLYGHIVRLNLPRVGSTLAAGEQISILGAARGTDTDGNRKHLHLGIHRGAAVDMRGYVQTQQEVNDFINPLSVLPTSILEATLEPEIQPYWKAKTPSASNSGMLP